MVSTDQIDSLAEKVDKLNIAETLTQKQREDLEKLQGIQGKHGEIEREFTIQLAALKKQFRARFEPLYLERKEILLPQSDAQTTIPSFWLTAMKNHQMIADMIESVDEMPLAYLQNIEATWMDGAENTTTTTPGAKSGFELRFTFSENPYFEQRELVKTYYMEMTEDDHDPVLCSTDATQITWKLGKDITKKTVTRKQKNKRTKQIRKLTETVSVPSFFNFFTKHDIPSEEELDNMNEEQVFFSFFFFLKTKNNKILRPNRKNDFLKQLFHF